MKKIFAVIFIIGTLALVNNIKGYITESAAPVPEPAMMLLFGTGLLFLAGLRFRKKK